MSNFVSRSKEMRICAWHRKSRFSVENVDQIFFQGVFLLDLTNSRNFYGIEDHECEQIFQLGVEWSMHMILWHVVVFFCLLCFAYIWILWADLYGRIYILGWTVCHMQIPESKANSSVCSNLVYVLYSMCFFLFVL